MTTERRNANKLYILEHGTTMTRKELAQACGVSEQTVGSFVRHHRIVTLPYVRRTGYTIAPKEQSFGWLMPDIEEYFRIPHDRIGSNPNLHDNG
jgi:hypothetical protein